MLAVSLVLAGAVSWFASQQPDGLERVALDTGFMEKAGDHPFRIFSAYTVPGLGPFWSNALAGIIGTLAVFGVTIILAKLAIRTKKQDHRRAPSSH